MATNNYQITTGERMYIFAHLGFQTEADGAPVTFAGKDGWMILRHFKSSTVTLRSNLCLRQYQYMTDT